jgi:hypothetical protein
VPAVFGDETITTRTAGFAGGVGVDFVGSEPEPPHPTLASNASAASDARARTEPR